MMPQSIEQPQTNPNVSLESIDVGLWPTYVAEEGGSAKGMKSGWRCRGKEVPLAQERMCLPHTWYYAG